MSFEIERRFLLNNSEWKKYIKATILIKQGYFETKSSEWVIRIRFSENKYKITFKRHFRKFTNYEFEYEIPDNEGKIILSKLSKQIIKERHFLTLDNKNWIIDCFKEDNYPLKIAEIELDNENEKIAIPDFISKEITGLRSFSNFELSQNPFAKWSEETLKDIYLH